MFQVENEQGAVALDIGNLIQGIRGFCVQDADALKCEAGSGALEVSVNAGTYYMGATEREFSGGSVHVDEGDGDPRKDIIYITESGGLHVTNGVPAPPRPDDRERFETWQPSPPHEDQLGGMVLAEVWVDEGATSIQNPDIRDRRIRQDHLRVAFRDAIVDSLSAGTVEIDSATIVDAVLDEADIDTATIVDAVLDVADIDTATIGTASISEAEVDEADLGQMSATDATLTDALLHQVGGGIIQGDGSPTLSRLDGPNLRVNEDGELEAPATDADAVLEDHDHSSGDDGGDTLRPKYLESEWMQDNAPVIDEGETHYIGGSAFTVGGVEVNGTLDVDGEMATVFGPIQGDGEVTGEGTIKILE